jgi:16S rRNA (cytosine967-C5)-methyltransferase
VTAPGAGPFERAAPSAEELGRASKVAAKVALRAHVEVLGGEGIRRALAEALEAEPKLGGQERRFAALAARELSRHQRLLDLAARQLGHSPGQWARDEDRALTRYVLWRRIFTGATWSAVGREVRLPGPLRPRTVPDRVLQALLEAPLPAPPLPEDAVERAAVWHSLPGWLSRKLAQQVEPQEVEPLFAALAHEPELILRVRGPQGTEAVVRELGEAGVEVEALVPALRALRVRGRGRGIFEAAAMKQGRLQVQDLGSQLIAELCRVEGPSPRAVDYCAGAGGKSLALVDVLGAGARIEAADKSARRLGEARRRVAELGVTQVRFTPAPRVEEADLVLVDAPCSGTGALGREPEAKWRLSVREVERYARIQRKLLDDVGARVRPGGALVYATCSLLREEDEEVVEGFLAGSAGWVLRPAVEVLWWGAPEWFSGAYLRVWPHRAAGGGYFAARLERRR